MMDGMKTTVLAAATRSRLWQKFADQWQTIQQWSPVQRRMFFLISLLLIVNIILVAKISTGQSEFEQASRVRRSIHQADQFDDESRGAIYIRWGRTVCPDETTLIYEGVTGGGYYTHEGSGANYVCLPLDPDYEDVSTSNTHAIMYGTEYQGLNFVSGKAVEDHNVPCAVCQSTARSNVLMVPAKNVCYPGWHLEYNGYLVSEHHTHKSSKMFECLDHEPETDQAGYRNENGALMYRTDGSCGALPCPAYEEGKALTCAVCTK